MKGHGTSYGAVSIINAIPCGIGSAVGIQLKIEAFFEESDGTKIELCDFPELGTELVSLCVSRTLERLQKDANGYSLTVKSQIPPSVGLKSSSAVCNAVILSILDCYKVHWNPFDVIGLGVDCAKECGVTVTGAFDDACCCMFGGIVVADTKKNELISQRTVPEYDVVICVPDGRIEKKDVDAEKYRQYSDKFRDLVPMVDSDFLNAMRENGRYVSEITGDSSILGNIDGKDILAAGITGTGPAVAIVTEKGKGEEISKSLDCRTIVTKTRSNLLFDIREVDGETDVPSSKSITHRAIFMATLSGKKCTIRDPLISLDTVSTLDAMRSMGVDVKQSDKEITIEAKDIHAPEKEVNVGNSGTTLRFMTALAATLDGTTVITGDESLSNRTVGPLLESLGMMNPPNTGKPPVTVTGPVNRTLFEIDGSMSSQFISALLMIAPTFGKPVDIDISGDCVSKPYVDMTEMMMGRFGINVMRTPKGYRVDAGEYSGFDYTVSRDYSAAAYPLIAGALGGKVAVKGLSPMDIQGDKAILDILASAGCCVSYDGPRTICERNNRLRGVDIDMANSPDLFPIVAVLLSVAEGTSRLYGAPHLRLKESDRIQTTVDMINALGGDATATDDGCVINGVHRLKGGFVDHHGDHRIMMAASVASIVCDGPVFMDDDGCWNTSFPGFPEMLRSLEAR